MDQRKIQKCLKEIEAALGEADPKSKTLCRLVERCGYVEQRKSRHAVYKHAEWQESRILTIPMHARLNPHTARSILKQVQSDLEIHLEG